MKFIEDSYNRHRKNMASAINDPERAALTRAWFDDTSIDNWRHMRMFEVASVLEEDQDAEWITIGDGRFGLDSIRLQKMGIKNVIPSNISGDLLEKSKNDRLISDYKIINAEKMYNIPDDSYDYVFCKEAYHHFPRPSIAFYEMLRIAIKAVILVEPSEGYYHFLSRLKYFVKKISKKQQHYDEKNYESVGNYVYRVSYREIEKMAIAINLPCIIYKGLNDYYEKGFEFEKVSNKSKAFKKIKRKILVHNILVNLGIKRWDLLMCVIYKQEISDKIKKCFLKNRWKIKELPSNPYA